MRAGLFPRSPGLAALAAGVAALLAVGPLSSRVSGSGAAETAREAIAAVIADRMGAGAEVTVTLTDAPADAGRCSDAVPDPGAKLGGPVWFTLACERPLPPLRARVLAQVHVIVPHAIARHAIDRGRVLTDEDIVAEHGEVTDLPIRRVPAVADLVGARTLRVIAASELVLSSAVAIRRAVQTGDPVTVIAVAGAVEVSAEMVAADSGDLGDIVRVVNSATRQSVRGRVIGIGRVEVIYGK